MPDVANPLGMKHLERKASGALKNAWGRKTKPNPVIAAEGGGAGMSPQVKALPSGASLDLMEENADSLAWVTWVARAPRGRGRVLATSQAERTEGTPCRVQSTLGNGCCWCHRPQELGPENPSLNLGVICI